MEGLLILQNESVNEEYLLQNANNSDQGLSRSN